MFTSRYHDVTCCGKTELLSYCGDLFLLKSFDIVSTSLFSQHDMLALHSKDLLVFQDTFTALIQFILRFKVPHTIIPHSQKGINQLSSEIELVDVRLVTFCSADIASNSQNELFYILETEIDLFMISIYILVKERTVIWWSPQLFLPSCIFIWLFTAVKITFSQALQKIFSTVIGQTLQYFFK